MKSGKKGVIHDGDGGMLECDRGVGEGCRGKQEGERAEKEKGLVRTEANGEGGRRKKKWVSGTEKGERVGRNEEGKKKQGR